MGQQRGAARQTMQRTPHRYDPCARRAMATSSRRSRSWLAARPGCGVRGAGAWASEQWCLRASAATKGCSLSGWRIHRQRQRWAASTCAGRRPPLLPHDHTSPASLLEPNPRSSASPSALSHAARTPPSAADFARLSGARWRASRPLACCSKAGTALRKRVQTGTRLPRR